MHLDDSLADDSGTKERPERHEEVAAGDPSEVKQGVRDLWDKKPTNLLECEHLTYLIRELIRFMLIK